MVPCIALLWYFPFFWFGGIYMKNNKKRLLRFIDECGTIRMIDFLKFYVGVTTQIKSLKRATHKNIKSFHFYFQHADISNHLIKLH